eukprot:5783849-Pyramimonas_sp.AAC.1
MKHRLALPSHRYTTVLRVAFQHRDVATAISSTARAPSACEVQRVPTGFAQSAQCGTYGMRHVRNCARTESHAYHGSEDSQAPTTWMHYAIQYSHTT